jgi:hypothetical protein
MQNHDQPVVVCDLKHKLANLDSLCFISSLDSLCFNGQFSMQVVNCLLVRFATFWPRKNAWAGALDDPFITKSNGFMVKLIYNAAY